MFEGIDSFSPHERKTMEASTNENSQRDILQYESQIWAVADLMRGVGIKDSKFPDFMMPFFALVMLESRMLNSIKKKNA